MLVHVKKRNWCSRGLTLIELVVTLAIFTAVTTVLLGSFIGLLSARGQIGIAQRINDSMRVTLDGIDREIQAGSGIVITNNGSAIRFTVSSRSEVPAYQVQYRLRNGVIEKAVQRGDAGDPCHTLTAGELPDVCYLPITGPEVTINTLVFTSVVSAVSQGQTSPLVTLGVSGTVHDSSGTTYAVSYSTTATPRNRITAGTITPNTPGAGPYLTLTGLTPLQPGCAVSLAPNTVLPIVLPGAENSNYIFYTDCTSVSLSFGGRDDTGMLHLTLTGPGVNDTRTYAGGTQVSADFTDVATGGANQVYTVRAENLFGNQVSNTISFFFVSFPSPDLVPTGIPALASGSLTQGTDVTFSDTVRNQGGAGTGVGFSTNFTYCWGAGCSPATLISFHTKAALGAGATAGSDTSNTLNLTNTGVLRVQYCVDSFPAAGVIPEGAGEGNNCRTNDFTVGTTTACTPGDVIGYMCICGFGLPVSRGGMGCDNQEGYFVTNPPGVCNCPPSNGCPNRAFAVQCNTTPPTSRPVLRVCPQGYSMVVGEQKQFTALYWDNADPTTTNCASPGSTDVTASAVWSVEDTDTREGSTSPSTIVSVGVSTGRATALAASPVGIRTVLAADYTPPGWSYAMSTGVIVRVTTAATYSWVAGVWGACVPTQQYTWQQSSTCSGLPSDPCCLGFGACMECNVGDPCNPASAGTCVRAFLTPWCQGTGFCSGTKYTCLAGSIINAQTRTVQCEDSNAPGIPVADTFCSGTKPATQQTPCV